MFGFGKEKKEPDNGISESAQRLIDLLGCPWMHIPKGTDPSTVLKAYDDAFAKSESGGYTPMIIVVDDNLLEDIEEHCTTPEELKANRDRLLGCERFDVQEWFSDRLGELKDCVEEDYWAETVGEIEHLDGDVSDTLSGFMDFGDPPTSEECILALIPTKEPWEVFAWLPFGGWNECPAPEEMLRLAQYWYERYKAVPAVMSHDVLEFSAPPINDKDAAMALALELYAACPDIVDQGLGTIGRLAGAILNSSVWYFWWD